MALYFVYIMASKKNGVLYVGYTSHLARRNKEHVHAEREGFTKNYFVRNLVYFEPHLTEESAVKREKQLKKWNRAWKIQLIEQTNPEWKNLAKSFFAVTTGSPPARGCAL